ncbi:MAG: UDP-N-acetylmuramoyl-tripeptide--D-alanyl-D-alanine ligase [Bacteroidales bacterium]|nr:UDP-N-acetylmuramoyl-tripeptide--D-alanyl-D-alanine ligase [Bacteroidales bacterium]
MTQTIEQIYHLFLQHPNVVTDSRNVVEEGIFFALKGETFDGNRFARKALDAGCNYAIVDDTTVAGTDDRFVVVDNVLETLQQLAHHHRQQFHIPVIGVTGTNGKTTTKELMAAVLMEKYRVLYTQGNLNNHIGVPLTLLQLNAQHQIAIIEMGANHPGEIASLVKLVEPTHGIITNIGKAHLEGFGSLEGIIQTKGALYDYLRQHHGYIFRNITNPYLCKIAGGTEEVTYALNELKAGVVGCIEQSAPFIALSWRSQRFQSGAHTVQTQFIGSYNAENILAAITFGLFFEVEPEQICHALQTYKPHNNRSQYIKTAKNEVIMDAYNANPASMEVALQNFHSLALDNKLLILGDMLELGETSLQEHQHVVDIARQLGFKQAILVGSNFSAVDISGTEYRKIHDLQMLTLYLEEHELKDYAILIKGSHGIGLDRVITLL